MPDGSANRLSAARPSIALDGADNAKLHGALLELEIRESCAGLYRCEAAFANWGGSAGFVFFDRATLDFGKTFEVRLGSDKLFEGPITALEAEFPEGAAPALRVLAEDRLQDLRMTRRTRSFESVTDAAAITQVAQDHGLTPQVNAPGPQHTALAQVNQSDLAFIRERARAVGAETWIDGSTLHVATRASRGGTPLTLALGGALREFRVVADLASQRTKVTVSGWDVAAKAALKGEAEASAVGGEVGGNEGGASLLSSKFADRVQVLAHCMPVTQEEADAQAKAAFLAIARRFVVGRGVAEADPKLRVGATVELEGLGPLFSGSYYVSATRTLFDGALGLRTEFTAERPGLGRP